MAGSPGVIVINQSATINAVLTGTEGMTKTGAGTLVLGAANTYTGGSFFSAGTVRIGNAAAIPSGSGNGNVTLGGTLDLNDTSITLNGLTGTGLVTNSSTGTPALTLGDDNTSSNFGGRLENGSGTTRVIKTGTGNLTLSGPTVAVGGGINVTDGRLTLNRNAAGGVALGSSVITLTEGREMVVAIGTGVSGGSVNMGTGSSLSIQNGNPQAGGAGFAPNIVLASGSGAADAASIGGFIYGNNTNLTGTISGSGDLRWRTNILDGGSNSATLSAANNTSGWAVNSYTGATSFEYTNLTFSLTSNATDDVINPFGDSANAVTQTAGRIRVLTGGTAGNTSMIENPISFVAGDGETAQFFREDGNLKLTGPVNISTIGSGKVLFTSLWGQINGKGMVLEGVLGGSGNLTISQPTNIYNEEGAVHLANNANSYNGTITVDGTSGKGGVLVLDANGAATNAHINLASPGAHLNVNAANATVASLSGVADSKVSARVAAQVLTVDQVTDTTFAGILGGTGITGTDAGLALVKSGTGTLTLSGANENTGATTVSGGTLALVGGSQTSAITVENNAALGFDPAAPTTSTAAVTFNTGSKVTVVGTPAPGTLMTASTIAGTPVLSPAIAGFALEIQGGNTLVLKSTGGGDFTTWIGGFTFAPGADQTPSGDPDNDGLSNQQEYAFGLMPNSGASVNPITDLLNPATGTFTYTRRDDALTTLTYKVWTSTDLAIWTEDPLATQDDSAGPNAQGVESVVVTLSAAKPLTAPKLFVRVTAE